MLQKWFEYERTFDGQQWIDFTREHADIPIFAVAAYLIIVFYVPTVLKNREKFNLKPAFAAWNLFLAVFSAVGGKTIFDTILSVDELKPSTYVHC